MCIDQGLESRALLTELSKAFYCLLQDLLIAKLNAYGVDIPALRFILITDDFEMANYADDKVPYVCGKDITSVFK